LLNCDKIYYYPTKTEREGGGRMIGEKERGSLCPLKPEREERGYL